MPTGADQCRRRVAPVCAPSLTCHVVAIVHSLTPSFTLVHYMACSFARGCWRSPYPTCHYEPTPPCAGRNWYCTRPRADWHSLKTKPVQTGVGGCQLLPAGADGSLNCAAVGGTCCAGGRSPHPTRPLILLSIPGGMGGCRPLLMLSSNACLRS